MNPSKILEKLKQEQLYRELTPLAARGAKIESPAGTQSRELLNFCSNDYLGLSQHPETKAAAIQAVKQYGAGATSSRLLSGHLDLHEELECKLAKWSGCYSSALSFGSGYLCNLGILQALLQADDAFVLFDRLNHASLIDGLRLAQASSKAFNEASGKRWQRYKHLDMQDLEAKLRARRQQAPEQTIWIITESVFSMDGDITPLGEIGRLAQKYCASWLLDEAHSIGIFGPRGAGLASSLAQSSPQSVTPSLAQEADSKLPDIVTANFAKSLGSYGGFCLCSAEWKEFFINFSRSLTYSTALPPASAAAALAAIEIIERSCQTTAQEATLQNAAVQKENTQKNSQTALAFRSNQFWQVPKFLDSQNLAEGLGAELLRRTEGFYAQLCAALPNGLCESLRPLSSPIVPLILGDNQSALSAAAQMQEKGFYVKAIRSPTVPPNTARLRFSLSLGHTERDLHNTVQALKICLQRGQL